jgi:alanine racemase
LPRAPAELEVDLGALARNYRKLDALAGTAELAAVVKANAYGLGVVRVASRLAEEGCRTFFVATLAEGIALRRSMPARDIYVFEGLAPGAEQTYAEHALRPVLNTAEQVRRWARIGRPAALHLDSGMSRLGLNDAELEALRAEGTDFAGAGIELLMTHLACADVPNAPYNAEQLERFHAMLARLPQLPVSIANSAGIFLGGDYHGSMVRAGIALYGGHPLASGPNPMESVATLRARILQLRTLDRSTGVGYGATYQAAPGDRLATVAIGYADGFPRMLGNRGHASVAGAKVPIVGRVSMDLSCLDVTSLSPSALAVGDYVELFGRSIAVDDVAALCDTISYEILCRVSARVERVYVD